MIRTIKSRDDIPALLTELGLTGWGAEIGVDQGAYSAKILAGSKLSRLFSVDPWAREDRGLPDDYPYWCMLEAQKNLRPFGLRSVLLRMDSVEAAQVFRPWSLDFVYIDAKHDYPSVREDIALWNQLVRHGGVIAGHDYEPEHQWWQVKRAVDEFVRDYELELIATELDSMEHGIPRHSWIVIKDGKCRTK